MPTDSPPVAVLLIDVVNAFDFDGAERLLDHARPASEAIARLADQAREAGVPLIYANDNYGEWTETFDALVERCVRPESPGCDVVRRVRPREGDYFVLKPKHSAFYQSSLATLLAHLGVRTLVLAGFATDICILATATDARMRDFRLVVPQDAVAAETERAHRATLAHLRRVLHAETPPASGVSFAALAETAEPEA